MKKNKLWIGGKWVLPESGKTFPTFSPATGEEIAQIPLAGQKEIDMAVAAARKVYPAWSQMLPTERSKYIRRIAVSFRDNAAEISRLETLEHGSILGLANNVPMIAAEQFEWAAGRAESLMGDLIPTLKDTLTYLKREPVGVCAIITPWNHAIIMMAVKLAQALSVGNTCILKPPSVNSLIGLKLAEVMAQAGLPPGVLNVITGPGGSVGNALASHAGVDLVGFTGSSATGKQICAAGAPTMKRMIMELGGKNPVIVLEDADIDAAVNHHAVRQCDNAGQHCSGAGRFYIHKKVYTEFLDKYIKATKKIVTGDPADSKTFMGPLANREHRDRVEAYIKLGVKEGAKLLLGGKRSTQYPMSKGWYVMPTILADVTQNMKVAREEIFGPVSIIMQPFTSEEEVIALANDNVYGLCATVWTRDIAKGIRFTNLLQAGTVNINSQVLTNDLPWGGYKESGIGKEGGEAGMLDYTQQKMVCVKIDE
jgi:acyl-CoA reductase-like NAD-dependent aldehyde dehydrogenase